MRLDHLLSKETAFCAAKRYPRSEAQEFTLFNLEGAPLLTNYTPLRPPGGGHPFRYVARRESKQTRFAGLCFEEDGRNGGKTGESEGV